MSSGFPATGARTRHGQFVVRALIVALASGLSSVPAHAETVVFHGGVNRASLDGVAEDFGRELAAGMQDLLGGTWTSSQGELSGLALGAGYRKGARSTVGLQLDVQFVQRGTKYELTARNVPDLPTTVAADVDLKFAYLEAVALVHLSPSPKARVRPMLMVGPALGLKVSSDLKVTIEGESSSQELSEGVAALTVGFLGGAGLAFQLSESSALTAQARYYLGLTDLMDNDPGSTKSRDLSFLVGVELDSGL